jgi:hypothetical protein
MGLLMNVKGMSATGPFAFVASVGDMTVDLLKQGLANDVPATQGEIVGQTVTVVSQSGSDGQAGPAGAPGESGGSSADVQPDFDGLYATDAASESLFKEAIADFTVLPSGALTISFSAFARALGGSTGTFRLRVGGTDGVADGTILATLSATSSSFQMLTTSGSYTNPASRVLVKLTGQSSANGMDVQVKSTLARFEPS